MLTLTADPIITAAEAQKIFDTPDEDTLVRLINSLSAKARTFLCRVQLNESLTDAIVENLRGTCSETIYLHAPVNVSDFSTYDVTVELYYSGVLSQTYKASANDILVTSDNYAARIDLVGGSFPGLSGRDFIRVTYFGGWPDVPGDIYAGAIMQGRVELKRMAGEIGTSSHSAKGQSIQVDQHGVLLEVADMWRPYRMLI